MLKGKKTWKATLPAGNFGGKNGKNREKIAIWTTTGPSVKPNPLNPLRGDKK
jgi:hypothetical protein